MSWKGPVCLLIIVVGFVLFLYGANYYDAAVGWAGVGFFAGGFVLYAVLKVCEYLIKG